ncbi:MAG: ACT domain-containing protein [Pyrinomonadaceae bacterium]
MKMVDEFLAKAKVVVAPETYCVISLPSENWFKLLENPELSPRMTSPFMIFKDRWEVTLVFDLDDFETIKHAIRDAKIEHNFRLLSFDVELPFDVVGFMAKVAGVFADAGISILPISSFSRDHVLLRQDDLAIGLKALRGHVDEIC